MRVWLMPVFSAVCGALVFACANGTTPGGDFIDVGEDSSTGLAVPPSQRDSGGPLPDAGGNPVDSSVAPKDSAVDAPVDTGTSGGSGDCVGSNSSQLSLPYDDACDNYFFNNLGKSNPCTPGGNACAAMNTGSLTFCCFKPPAGSFCDDDYNGTPQCLPK